MSARRLDRMMIIVLILLWGLFFWRILTPIAADQASFTQGDFSGQFFAFAGYQYVRFTSGEIPLWNPHNNGGLPFIADTQAAVFYPPRLLTIALAYLGGGWSYAALQIEVIAHVLAFTLLMYALARKLTGSPFAGLVAALIAGYGGFMTGYPPLQLAILEAGAWFPAAALGIVTATADETRPLRLAPLTWTGFALGLSWLAGHPQTSFFITLLLLALLAWRCYERRDAGWRFAVAVLLFGTIALGLSAVQLLPGIEYLTHTTRVDFGYDAKANGFPIGDVVQMALPGVISQWSPLYVGMTGIILAAIGIWRRGRAAVFWIVVGGIALLWSFGDNGALFPVLYNLVPGLRFFRGQERAAFVFTIALALMAAWGADALARWSAEREHGAGLRLRLTLYRLLMILLVLTTLIFLNLIAAPSAYALAFNRAVLAVGAVGGVYLLTTRVTVGQSKTAALYAIALILAFELVTVGMNAAAVYDPIPPDRQTSTIPSPLVAAALTVSGLENAAARVDGSRGLTDNYASLYGLHDIRGISPLWLAEPYAIIEGDMPDARAWEVFAVDRVFSDWAELPVPARIIASGSDRYGAVNLHRLDDPRPFALIQHDVWTVMDAREAYDVLSRDSFVPRQTVILEQPVTIDPGDPTAARVVSFAPERIVIAAASDGHGILSIALPTYPGWYATLDGTPIEILRAYGALAAIALPPGSHTVELVYNPLTYRIGAIVSAVTLTALMLFGAFTLINTIRKRAAHDHAQSPPKMGRASG